MSDLPMLPPGCYATVASRIRGHATSPPGFRTHRLGEKALDCLVFLALNTGLLDNDEPTFSFAVIAERWDALCGKWGEKVVWVKLDELAERGYIEYGVSARSGWLTEKGIEKLREYAQASPDAG